jgi:hypothetical protein
MVPTGMRRNIAQDRVALSVCGNVVLQCTPKRSVCHYYQLHGHAVVSSNETAYHLVGLVAIVQVAFSTLDPNSLRDKRLPSPIVSTSKIDPQVNSEAIPNSNPEMGNETGTIVVDIRDQPFHIDHLGNHEIWRLRLHAGIAVRT